MVCSQQHRGRSVAFRGSVSSGQQQLDQSWGFDYAAISARKFRQPCTRGQRSERLQRDFGHRCVGGEATAGGIQVPVYLPPVQSRAVSDCFQPTAEGLRACGFHTFQLSVAAGLFTVLFGQTHAEPRQPRLPCPDGPQQLYCAIRSALCSQPSERGRIQLELLLLHRARILHLPVGGRGRQARASASVQPPYNNLREGHRKTVQAGRSCRLHCTPSQGCGGVL
mmetsp:Transcript_45068/g.88479  ORF Transcript_45068/g.88479 Transcript_45068/m.88479 type:complete len:223 (+) Transcript_45068:78-746(+)